MEDGQRSMWWRKAVAIGGAVLALLLLLMAIGLALGRKNDSSRQVSRGTVEEKDGSDAASPPANAAEMMRRIEGESGIDEGGESGEKSADAPMSDDDAAGGDEMGATGDIAGTRTSVGPAPTVEVKAIRTASLTVEIEKGTYNEAYSAVSLVAEGAGGYVSDSRSASSEGRITSGTVTMRVPNSSYADVMNRLKEMGNVSSISEQAQDVTEEYVDLESRIRNLRAQESVYLNLMSKAQTIEESISVQRELSVIQEQIEQLTGRKNYLDNHVQLSTIQVTLTEPGSDVAVDGDGWGFVDALSDALHGVVDGLSAVIRFLGDALVYILILALIGLGLYFVIKRFNNKKE